MSVKSPKGASGVSLIMAERERQIGEEGYSEDHDDELTDGSIAQAAAAYAWPGHTRHEMWPWAKEEWKPCLSRVRELVKAGALIAAEIDRLQRRRK